MHLSKVKMNIGTLKAFGLSNTEARNIYFQIIARFLGIALLMGITASILAGWITNKILVAAI